MATQPRKIVVAFDGSPAAARALDAAAQLVGYGSTLTVVVVSKANGKVGRRRLASAREKLFERQVLATYVARAGEPAHELIEACHEFDADLVVVGGHDGPDIESVASEVLRRTTTNVLVVR